MNAHGTRKAYEDDGCRCDICRAANTRRNRMKRIRRDRAGNAVRNRDYRERQRRNAEQQTAARVPPASIYEHGACIGAPTDWFFPGRGLIVAYNDELKSALALCADCTVRDVCLRWALENNEIGVWGGTTGLDRRQMTAQQPAPRPRFRTEPPQTVRMHGARHGGEVIA